MTVYVDDWRQLHRVGHLNSRWSHLICGPFDDLAELHEFAARIGLKRSWFQDKPWPRAHYDVTESKRVEAVAAGATEITWRETGRLVVRAVDARRRAMNSACTRTIDGKPPGDDDWWAVARALYELACAEEAPDASTS
jgi:hypothetical protein